MALGGRIEGARATTLFYSFWSPVGLDVENDPRSLGPRYLPKGPMYLRKGPRPKVGMVLGVSRPLKLTPASRG